MIISMLKKSAYGKTIGLSLSSKAIFMVSSIGILWLLAHILPKDDFGLFMLAQVVIMIASGLTSSGFQNLAMYKVTRLENKGGEAAQIGGTIAALGVISALFTAVAIYLLSDSLAKWFDKPDWMSWLKMFAFLIPLEVVRVVLVFWHRAKFNMGRGIFFLDAGPNLFRFVFLAVVYILALPDWAVIGAYYAAATICIAWLFIGNGLVISLPSKLFTRWDRDYCLKIALTRGINQPGRSLDIILVGFFLAAEILAEYTMAARLAIFLMIGKNAILPLLTPRMGRHFERNDLQAVVSEFTSARLIGVLIAVGGAIATLLFGEVVLNLLNDYGDAYPILIVLSAVMVVRAMGGASGEYLNMAGYAGWKLITTCFSIGTCLILSIILIDIYGVMGAAYGLLISECLMHGFLYMVIRFKHGVSLVHSFDILLLGGFLTTICLSSYMPNFDIMGAAILSVLLALYMRVRFSKTAFKEFFNF